MVMTFRLLVMVTDLMTGHLMVGCRLADIQCPVLFEGSHLDVVVELAQLLFDVGFLDFDPRAVVFRPGHERIDLAAFV